MLEHLLIHGTMNLEILRLLSGITHMFAEHGVPGDKILEGIASGLAKLNPFDQLKTASIF